MRLVGHCYLNCYLIIYCHYTHGSVVVTHRMTFLAWLVEPCCRWNVSCWAHRYYLVGCCICLDPTFVGIVVVALLLDVVIVIWLNIALWFSLLVHCFPLFCLLFYLLVVHCICLVIVGSLLPIDVLLALIYINSTDGSPMH